GRGGLDLLDGLARRVQLARLERGHAPRVPLARAAHQSTTSRPMERAVPATIRIAASMSFALRSGILISAIRRTWARVTLPTFWRLEVGESFSWPGSFFRSTDAGGVLVMKEIGMTCSVLIERDIAQNCTRAVCVYEC